MLISIFGTWLNPDHIIRLEDYPGWPAKEGVQEYEPPYTFVYTVKDGFKIPNKTADQVYQELNNRGAYDRRN